MKLFWLVKALVQLVSWTDAGLTLGSSVSMQLLLFS